MGVRQGGWWECRGSPGPTHQLLNLQLQLVDLVRQEALQGSLEPDHERLKAGRKGPGDSDDSKATTKP